MYLIIPGVQLFGGLPKQTILFARPSCPLLVGRSRIDAALLARLEAVAAACASNGRFAAREDGDNLWEFQHPKMEVRLTI